MRSVAWAGSDPEKRSRETCDSPGFRPGFWLGMVIVSELQRGRQFGRVTSAITVLIGADAREQLSAFNEKTMNAAQRKFVLTGGPLAAVFVWGLYRNDVVGIMEKMPAFAF